MLVLLVVILSAILNVCAYSQVYQSQTETQHMSMPRIFKALNTDLLMMPQPKNETQIYYVTPYSSVTEAQTTTEVSSSGRAIYTSNSVPFINAFQTRRPTQANGLYRPQPSYQKTGSFSDRFSPSEAIVSNALKKKNRHQYQPNIGEASNNAPTYVPPNDLYAFPPNSQAIYPPPTLHDPRGLLLAQNVSSYKPPASGPLEPNLPPSESPASGPLEPNLPPSDEMKDIGVLPASLMPQDSKDQPDDYEDSLPKLTDPSMHFPHPYEDSREYATPPPNWHDNESNNDDYLHQDHHILYDNLPEYHHHHHDHNEHQPHQDIEPLPPRPKEPPPEPRVKKYSYFYIGRKLWYIPLYFTVWFSFYVLWLILKSIARHKVDLPNHYTARRRKRSNSFMPSETLTHEYINKLTVSLLNGIEQFTNNYLN